MPFARESFFIQHSIISNKIPKRVPLSGLARMPREVQLENFGLWEASSPNFNTFYPDLTAEDLLPKEGDYVMPVFRALSEVIVNKYGPIDFKTPGVLKASTRKLLHQTLYANHDPIIGSEIGVVAEVFWEKSYTTADGFEIPAGINVRLKVDGKSHPNIARAVMSDPPAIHSVSVTVAFKWDKSHSELTDDEFWNKLGSFDEKGELIRRVVTEVFSYEEISFVSHGADPYAQKVGKDGIHNPAYADNRNQFSADELQKNGTFFDWKEFGTSSISLSADSTIPTSLNNNDNNSTKHGDPMNEALKKFLIQTFGLAADATEAQILEKLKGMNLTNLLTAQTENTRLTGELGTANQSLTALRAQYPEGSIVITKEQQADLSAYPAVKATNDKVMSELRGETLKFYNMTNGGADKADPAITRMINEAAYDTLVSLNKQYVALADKSHPATCNDCKSTNISRASAAGPGAGVQNGDGTTGSGKAAPVEKSLAEVLETLAESPSKTYGIHGPISTK